jgi:hypothetical protein
LVSKAQTRQTIQVQSGQPLFPVMKDARLVNAYAEMDVEDKDYWVYKRFGLGPPTLTGSGQAQGIYTDPLGLLAALIGGVFTINGTAVPLTSGINAFVVTPGTGTPPQVYGKAFFESCLYTGSSPPLHFIAMGVVGGLGYLYNTNTQVGATITSPTFPANAGYSIVPGWAYLDGTLYIMDTVGNIWGSNLGDPTSWNALNVIKASSNADLGVALIKQLSYIIALKQYTAQIFYDAGNATGSPLSPVPDAQLPYGCVYAGTVQQIDNTVLWITSNQTISPQLVRMDNLAPSIVSLPAIDRLLDNVCGADSSSMGLTLAYAPTSWVIKHAGHRFYGLNVPLLNLTLVYDIDQDFWYYWTDSSENWWGVVGTAYIPPSGASAGTHLALNQKTSSYGPIDECYVYPTDNGSTAPVDIYTPNMDFGTFRRKHLNSMFFNGDKVQGIMKVRYSDDDYNTWSNFRSVDLSRNKPRLANCGTFDRRRAINLRYQAPTAWRQKSIDLQMDIGTT